MAEISAAAVKAFRERTGLPLMACKEALAEAQGDQEKAIELIRKRGETKILDRSGRETAFGRFGIYVDSKVGAMVELKCESAPVSQNDEFVSLAQDLAKQLAVGPGAKSAEELLEQTSPGKGVPLKQQKLDLFNRIGEVFNVGRLVRFDGPCGAYEHPGTLVHGVLCQASGPSDAVRDICMHIAAMGPKALRKEDLDPSLVAKEREILRAAALQEGKPENIVDKMVEGRLRNFYAEKVLLEQQFVKDDSQTVGQYAKSKGVEIQRFAHWILGESESK